jgi:hypothetical protein
MNGGSLAPHGFQEESPGEHYGHYNQSLTSSAGISRGNANKSARLGASPGKTFDPKVIATARDRLTLLPPNNEKGGVRSKVAVLTDFIFPFRVLTL